MTKFGEKNRSFVVKSLALAKAHPELLPASFDLDEFRRDVGLIQSLYPVRQGVEELYGKLDDTYYAAGSEAYAAALLVYQYAKLHPQHHYRRIGRLPRRPRRPLRPQNWQKTRLAVRFNGAQAARLTRRRRVL